MNYKYNLSLALCFSFLILNIPKLTAQFHPVYGNQIIISDHVPSGDDPTPIFVNACDCNEQLAYSNTSITTPGFIDIPWSSINLSDLHKYKILVNGPLKSNKFSFISETYFAHESGIQLMNCGVNPPSLHKTGYLDFYNAHAEYNIKFYQLGFRINFTWGNVHSVKIYELSNCINFSASNSSKRYTTQVKELALNLSPNPFNNKLNIAYKIPHATTASLSIYNTFGQELIRVFDKKLIEKGKYQLSLNLDLPNGIYYAILRTKEDKKVMKLIKQ